MAILKTPKCMTFYEKHYAKSFTNEPSPNQNIWIILKMYNMFDLRKIKLKRTTKDNKKNTDTSKNVYEPRKGSSSYKWLVYYNKIKWSHSFKKKDG